MKDEDLFFLKDEDLLEVFGWMVAINPVGQVALKIAIVYSSASSSSYHHHHHHPLRIIIMVMMINALRELHSYFSGAE